MCVCECGKVDDEKGSDGERKRFMEERNEGGDEEGEKNSSSNGGCKCVAVSCASGVSHNGWSSQPAFSFKCCNCNLSHQCFWLQCFGKYLLLLHQGFSRLSIHFLEEQ